MRNDVRPWWYGNQTEILCSCQMNICHVYWLSNTCLINPAPHCWCPSFLPQEVSPCCGPPLTLKFTIALMAVSVERITFADTSTWWLTHLFTRSLGNYILLSIFFCLISIVTSCYCLYYCHDVGMQPNSQYLALSSSRLNGMYTIHTVQAK